MSKAGTCQQRSDRMRSVCRGSYTNIFTDEYQREKEKRINMTFTSLRSGGRRW